MNLRATLAKGLIVVGLAVMAVGGIRVFEAVLFTTLAAVLGVFITLGDAHARVADASIFGRAAAELAFRGLGPLEGVLLVVPGAALAAIGGFVGDARQRWFLLGAFLLVAAGVATLSSIAGHDAREGPAALYLFAVLPYPVGWLMALGGAMAALRKHGLG